MPDRRLWRFLAALLTVSLLVAACGSDSSSETSVTTIVSPSTDDSRQRGQGSGRDRSTSTTGATVPQSTDTTTTTAPPASSTTQADTSSSTTTGGSGSSGTDPVGVVGCSNTHLAVGGYLEASSVDRIITGNLGGGSVSVWGDPANREYGEYWGIFDAETPPGGYSEVFMQLCLRTSEHNGAFDAAEQEWVAHMVAQVHARHPGITIWISPVNTYAEGLVCSSIGPDGPAIAAQAADWGAANLANVSRGPDLGPLEEGQIAQRDDCHPNSAGQDLLGAQLVSFFD